MTGIYIRVEALMDHLDDKYKKWRQSLYFRAVREVIPMSCREFHEFEVDRDRKVFKVTGRNINFFNDSEYDEMDPEEHSFSEETALELYKSLQKVAMEDIDLEFKSKEEEQKQVEYEKRKKSYLNKKIFGQSFDFIMEE